MISKNMQVKIPKSLKSIKCDEIKKINLYNSGKINYEELLEGIHGIVNTMWKNTRLFEEGKVFYCKKCVLAQFSLQEMAVQGRFKFLSLELQEFSEHWESHKDFEKWYAESYEQYRVGIEKENQAREERLERELLSTLSHVEYEVYEKLYNASKNIDGKKRGECTFGGNGNQVTWILRGEEDVRELHDAAISIINSISGVENKDRTIMSIGIENPVLDDIIEYTIDVIYDELVKIHPFPKTEENISEVKDWVGESMHDLSARDTVAYGVEKVYEYLRDETSIYDELELAQVSK